MADNRHRHWCGTSYKTLSFKHDIERLKEQKFEYLVCQKERCPKTQREHYQFYVEFKHPQRMDAVKKAVGDQGAHLEARKGTREQVNKIEKNVRCQKNFHAETCCNLFLNPYKKNSG